MENRQKRKRMMEFEDMIRKYQEGYSTEEIGKLANVSARYVRQVLVNHNIEMRPRGSWKRKYNLNENYFKTWSNNMAYILGFFVADGTVIRDAQSISFSQKEKYILENIRGELESNHPIYQNPKTDVYMLNINSKIMKTDLMEMHGIMPAKSNTVKFPYVPDQYMNHFIRGYFDGDGYVNYEKYNITFTGGSSSFMNSLIYVLEKHGFFPSINTNGSHYWVQINGRKTLKLFANWIYESKTLYLKRKFMTFEQETLEIYELKDNKHKNTKTAIEKRKSDFIKAYATCNSEQEACDCVNIKIQTYHKWLKTDKNFKQKMLVQKLK